MTDPKPFASLSPSLLARKGSARPAMRPQIQPLRQFHEATARQIEDDLGWNDMGHDHGSEDIAPTVPPGAEVVSLSPEAAPSEAAGVPEVVRQPQGIAAQVANAAPEPPTLTAVASKAP
ncbi:MAG TPA: hypothetical protein PKD92_12360, partial [Novosphingobium sp.]|nr:hypothetical protein [Novosphingobium sp.]